MRTILRAAPEGPDAEPRVIGPTAAFALVLGSMLGVGIFLAPPLVAQHATSEPLFYAVWVVGALTALAGGVAFAELATLFPRAGGDYVYHREAYGTSMSLATGWTLFACVFTGSIAGIAASLCEYQIPAALNLGSALEEPVLEVLGWRLTGARLLAVGLVAGVTALNLLGTRLSALSQVVMTAFGVVCLTGLAVVALLLPSPDVPPPAADTVGRGGLVAGFVAAYLPVYFAYSGWNAVVYVAGEVEQPGRTIPRALIGGVAAIALVYLVICAAFVERLGLPALAALPEAGTGMALAIGGPAAAQAANAVILVALLGALNASVMAGARLALAMGRTGALPRVTQRANSRGAPAGALALQAVIAGLLLITGTFAQLIDLVSLSMIVIGLLTVVAMFVLRRTRPHAARPYLASGYPWLPAFYILANAAVVCALVYEALSGSSHAHLYPLAGLAFMLVVYAGHRARSWRRLAPEVESP